MATPATADRFLELVYKSEVADRNRLDRFVERWNAGPGRQDEPSKLARAMVRDGLLTRFQAEQLLQGKWRRFAIGNYKVLERLGAGGMGSVYLCEHRAMRHQVAIKVLASNRADDPVIVKRFFREGRAAAALDHPNIVRAHDIGQDGELHFLVMEYVYGSSLHAIVEEHGPLSVERAAHYVYQAALGLHHAHLNGLVHRDIKPANLILERTGTVKILDMGMALFAQGEEARLTYNLIGTADYLAPEQARDSHRVDVRADIYGLGATLYFLLTGKPPFEDAKSVGQKLVLLQTTAPKPIRELRPQVPPKLTAIVERMMAKDPAQRYQSMADVVQALAPWGTTQVPPPSEAEMPRLSPAAQSMKSTEIDLALPGGPTSHDRRSVTLSRPVPRPPRQSPPIWAVVAISVFATAGVMIGIWWLFLRPAA